MPSKRRKQGEKFPEGFIKRKITLIVADYFPDGIEEPDLREILREKWNIREAKGVRTHLKDLRKDKILVKESRGEGRENIWKVNPDPLKFKDIANLLLKSEDRLEFVQTKYAQDMINRDFIQSCAEYWYENYWFAFKDGFEKLKESKDLESMKSTMKQLTETMDRKEKITLDLLDLSRQSPLFLYCLMFPEEAMKELGILLKNIEPILVDISILKEELEKKYKEMVE